MTGLTPHQAGGQPIPDEVQKNTAWVSIEIPVSPGKLFAFLQNTERLFRLNPYLDIHQWEALAGGKQFHLKALNEMNGVTYDLAITLESTQPGASILLGYSKGLKRALEITLRPGVGGAAESGGSILTLREHYHEPAGENQVEQLKEVDHGLTHWAASIRQYLLGWERWSWFWPYRWYKGRFWLSMRPTHRRISRLLIWVTVLEFVVFLFIFTIYWLELARV